jgi:hypothetical protein
MLTFGVNTMIPIAEFQRESPGVLGVGLQGGGLIRFWKAPVYVGLDGSVYMYGTKTITEPGLTVGGGNIDLRVTRNNFLFAGHVAVRFQPEVESKFQPYAQLLGGMHYLFTMRNTRESRGEEPFESVAELEDYTWSLGIAGGVNYYLTNEFAIDFRITALKGGRADYLTDGAVRFDPVENEVIYRVRRSFTDHLSPTLGIRYFF